MREIYATADTVHEVGAHDRKNNVRRRIHGLRKILGCFGCQRKPKRSRFQFRLSVKRQLQRRSKLPENSSDAHTTLTFLELSANHHDGLLKAPSKPLKSDMYTQTADEQDKADLFHTLAEVTWDPTVEPPVETIRAAGKPASTPYLKDNDDKAVHTVVTPRRDAAAESSKEEEEGTRHEVVIALGEAARTQSSGPNADEASLAAPDRQQDVKAVGKSASTPSVHDNADEALPAVLTSNNDLATVEAMLVTSDGSTHTEDKPESKTIHRTDVQQIHTEVGPAQTVERVVEETRALGKAARTQSFRQNADEASLSVAAPGQKVKDQTPLSEEMQESETGVKASYAVQSNLHELGIHSDLSPIDSLEAENSSAIHRNMQQQPLHLDENEHVNDASCGPDSMPLLLQPSESSSSELHEPSSISQRFLLLPSESFSSELHEPSSISQRFLLLPSESSSSELHEPSSISRRFLLQPSESSSSELHEPSSISQRFLSFKETQELNEMQRTTGKFSYYILNNGRVIVYPEDEKATKNQALLKSSFIETTGNEFDVLVKESSFDGTFCTHRIGAKMLAAEQPTTVGMYVTYDGVLYFISSAHNFVLFTTPIDLQSNDRREILYDGKLALFDVMGTQAPIVPLYYIFSNTTSLESRGQRIMHAADISICQAPIFTHLITKGIQQFSASLQEGQDSCRDCLKSLEECFVRGHRRDAHPCQYKVSRFYDFQERLYGSQLVGEQIVQFVRSFDRTLLDALVRCRPSGESVVAGRVLSFDNRLIFSHPRRDPFDAYNVLLIKPETHARGPKPGDSGSVWVMDGTDAALAITIGMGRGEDGVWLWAAAPLKPLLEGLCCAFPNHFTDASKIKPVQLCNGVSATMHGYNNLANESAAVTPSSGGQIARSDSAYATNYSHQTE